GLVTLRNCAHSRKRRDVLDRISADKKTNNEVLVHAQCRKAFTDKRKVDQLKKEDSKENRPLLRSDQPPFAFDAHCFFCAQALPTPRDIKKNPSRYLDVKCIQTSEAEATVKAAISGRSADEWAKQVQLRVDSVLSLFAADARYHLQCYRNFTHPRHLATPSPSPTHCHRGRLPDQAKQRGFEELCKFLEANDECQFSTVELSKKLQELTVGEAYSERQALRKLQERYGENIVLVVKSGGKSVLCFKGTASRILTDNWYAERKADPSAERLRVVKAAAAILRQDIRGAIFNTQQYPTPQQIAGGDTEPLPVTLQVLVNDVIGGKGKAATRKAAYIEQCIVSAARPRSYVSPLKHGLALLLHTRYGSRDLLSVLSAVGAVADYADAVCFETSAAHASAECAVQPGAFQQYVADNADFDVGTLDGHNTFHVLGMVKSITPSTALTYPEAMTRGQCTAAAKTVSHLAKVPLYMYPAPAVPGLQLIKVAEIDFSAGESEALHFKRLNAVWLSSFWAEVDNSPGWNGFMSRAFQAEENYAVSKVLPLPFVHLQPSNPSAIYSSLLYASQESSKLGQDHCLVTFDFPLYIKAVDIVYASPSDSNLRATVLRLGGFHLLMSFLGAIGSLMAGSGIEEMWQTVYAKNSVKHLVSGHAYARAVRAHLLSFRSIATILLTENNFPDEETVQSEVECMVEQILAGEVQHSDAANSALADKLLQHLCFSLDSAEKNGRTQKLWVQYFRCVEIVTLFIAAERSGNFKLHLHCIGKMLPFFHASGHLNYAKGAHLYLQQMNSLETLMSPLEFEKFTSKGFFTIRRTEKFWSGTWSDMIIEQVLMKWMKSVGGLTRGRGVSDEVVARALHSLPETSRIMAAVEEFCGMTSASSEQHVELRDSRRRRDQQDLEKFLLFLKLHNPFEKHPDELVSLSSGAVGDKTINCDRAEELGKKSLLMSVGKDFKTLKLHRKDACKSLASLSQTHARVGDDNVEINSNQLFHRSLCVLKTAEEIEAAFEFEMAARAPALFENCGSMRKGCKSTLAEVLVAECAAAVTPALDRQSPHVVDGGYLLHKVQFPRPATFSTIADTYCSYVSEHWGTGVTVVFDGYSDRPSTKSEEQQRRAARASCIDVNIHPEITTSIPQQKFLSNNRNKVQLISLLTERLQGNGVEVVQADGDADTVIVQTALAVARRAGCAVVVGEDTDLLILLLHHVADECVFMLKPGRVGTQGTFFNVKIAQETLKGLHKYLLFLHAFSGCDTTAAFFRKGKKIAWNTLKKCGNDFLQSIEKFYAESVSAENLSEVGEQFVRMLYGVKERTPLNQVRYQLYQRTIAKQPLTANFDLAVLPPTSASTLQHCLRVYHQVGKYVTD
ncbi:Elongation factor 4, partial [Frankliniella fusca]